MRFDPQHPPAPEKPVSTLDEAWWAEWLLDARDPERWERRMEKAWADFVPTGPEAARSDPVADLAQRVWEVGLRLDQPVLDAPYRTALCTCWQCGQETLVYAWDGHQDWSDPSADPWTPALVGG